MKPAADAWIDDHGGSIGRARALYPHAPEPWVDLSTGINPNAYPFSELPATAFCRLPEPGRLHRLLEVAAEAYGAPSAAHVTAAPGTQILLPQVMALRAPGRALVLGPTYAEHARAAALVGHSVEEATDPHALREADLAIVVNPNNPDGRLLSREAILDIADALVRRGGMLVVDEAFMDVMTGGPTLAADVAHPGIVVLRSFGKFFGLAGVRLGFALAHPQVAARLAAGFGPWAVSGPALELGIRALADRDWQDATRARLAAEAGRLDALLEQAGMAVAGGTTLYRFLMHPQAGAFANWLGARGILVRTFSWNTDALRLGLPGSEPEWQRLEEAVVGWRAATLRKDNAA